MNDTKNRCDLETEAQNVCQRLLDSEEHAVDAAIPEVAEDAVEIIARLQAALVATQTALSQAMQHGETANKFITRVAGLSMWSYSKDDGTPCDECEEPSEGFIDSHCCLMSLIEEARKLEGGADHE